MIIKRLPEHIINQICAGEIAEKPSSIIKELIENSIDAGASEIKILLEDAGKSKIVIWDNGSGMSKEDLLLSVERHTTSKLKTDDLFNITSLGFRGEALASIASVAKLKIITSNGNEAWELKLEDGKALTCTPASRVQGTTVEVSDLFYKIPARAKFLKSDKSEMSAINNLIEKIAIANPNVYFNVNDKLKFNKGSYDNRISEIMGDEFFKNSLKIDTQRENYKLDGFISLPSYNKGNSLNIYIFVNGRIIRDKNLTTLIKVAYQDVMAYDRYPVCVLNLHVDPHEVDINVHPSKLEVRFLQEGKIRSFIMSALKQAINDYCLRDSFQNVEKNFAINEQIDLSSESGKVTEHSIFDFKYDRGESTSKPPYPSYSKPLQVHQHIPQIEDDYPLGFAVTQMFKTYILSKAGNDFFIIDQHAVHERIVLEKINNREFKRQILLIPDQFKLGDEYVEIINNVKTEIESLGVIFKTENDEVIIIEIPDYLYRQNLKEIFIKICEEIAEFDFSKALEKTIHKINSTVACHGSIRAGQELSVDEMNAILRQLEITPRASVCNHGRPTFFKVDKKWLDKLFERI